MSQNVVDFSGYMSGAQLLDSYMTPLQSNMNTNNSGQARPSYLLTGGVWYNTTDNKLMLYNGVSDVALSHLVIASEDEAVKGSDDTKAMTPLDTAKVVGVSSYSSTRTYAKNDVVLGVEEEAVYLYRSLVDDNLNNALTDSTKWSKTSVGVEDPEPVLGGRVFTCELVGDEAVGWLLAGNSASGATYTTAWTKLNNVITNGTEETYTYGELDEISYKTLNGINVALIAQKTAIDALYTATGVANFWIVDSDNTTFYAPRNDYVFYAGNTSAGAFVDQSLPNIKGEAFLGNASGAVYGLINNSGTLPTGVFKRGTSVSNRVNQGGQGGSSFALGLDASGSSTVYQDDANVKMRGVQGLLYYRIGNTIVNSSTIDVETLTADVVDLQNTKANTDFDNLTDDGLSALVNFNAPASEGEVIGNQSNLASGTEFTAPEAGFYILYNTAAHAQDRSCYITNNTNFMRGGESVQNSLTTSPGTGNWIYVSKNDKVTLNYSQGYDFTLSFVKSKGVS